MGLARITAQNDICLYALNDIKFYDLRLQSHINRKLNRFHIAH